MVTIAFTILAYIFIMLFLYQQKNNLTLYLATFTFAFQDSQQNTISNVILGFEFESTVIPFSVYRCLLAFTTFVFIMVQSFIQTDMAYFMYFTLAISFGIISLLILLKFDFKVS